MWKKPFFKSQILLRFFSFSAIQILVLVPIGYSVKELFSNYSSLYFLLVCMKKFEFSVYFYANLCRKRSEYWKKLLTFDGNNNIFHSICCLIWSYYSMLLFFAFRSIFSETYLIIFSPFTFLSTKLVPATELARRIWYCETKTLAKKHCNDWWSFVVLFMN